MSANPIFYVYVLFRETGAPFYIGKGKSCRWNHHKWQARSGIQSHKCAIIRDMQTRGVEIIKVKLHDGLTEEVAHTYEIALIKAIGRGDDGPLVNHTDGGEGISGFKMSPEERAKRSVALAGKTVSPETRANMSAAQRGRTFSAEHLAKLSAVRRGKKQSAETLGRKAAALRGTKQPHSPEHIAKIAAALRGGRASIEARANMSAASIGKPKSPEARANMSTAQRRRAGAKRLAA